MDTENWTKAKDLFGRALELSGEERSTFVRRACSGNEDLRRHLLELIEAHEAAGKFLASPPARPEEPSSHDERPGALVGRYKLLQLVGEGAFGSVWMAEQHEPVARRVAIKIVKLGLDTKQVVVRFEAERQALAMMDHPNIAKVLDGGVLDSGRPYFVMELVNGVAITKFCDEANLSTALRLQLFRQVCQAVQHAHQKGVIHRDLKPSNILVTLLDGTPTPKVIDFGVAKATGVRLTEKTLFTQLGAIVGTPEYMSPEQAALSGLDVDTRCDVYSLGVLLYELLTGTKPFEIEALVERGYHEILRCIREIEPPKPSTRISTLADRAAQIAARRSSAPEQLTRLVRGDLDWIVMKALEKDRTRRYETANALADDIGRFLDDQPVMAMPPRPIYLLAKFVRRNRLMVGATVAVAVTGLAGLGVAALGFWRASHERDARGRVNTELERVNEALLSKNEEVASALHRVRLESYAASIMAASANLAINQSGEARRNLERCDASLRGWEWQHFWNDTDTSLNVLRAPKGSLGPIAFSPDGTRIAGGNRAGDVQLWDARSGALQAELPGHASCIRSLLFRPDSMHLITGSSDMTIRIWDLATGAEQGVFRGHVGGGWPSIGCLSASPDGSRLASGGSDNTARVWDMTTHGEIAVLRGHASWVDDCAFSADGSRLFTASADQELRMWDAHSGVLLDARRIVVDGARPGIALARDASRVAIATVDHAIVVVDRLTQTRVARLRGHDDNVNRMAFNSDGTRLVSGSRDGTVRTWDVTNDVAIACHRGHMPEVWEVAFSPDGSKVASASWDGTVRVWDSVVGVGVRILRGQRGGEDLQQVVAFSPDGERVAATAQSPTVAVWDTDTGEQVAQLTGHEGFVRAVCFDHGGAQIASGADDSTVRLWDPGTSSEIATYRGHGGTVNSVAFSPDDSLLASAATDTTIRIWSGTESIALLRGHEAQVWSVDFSPDGARLVSGSHDGTVRVWDVDRAECVMVLRGHEPEQICAVYDQDGARILSGSRDNSIRVWDALSGRQLALLRNDSPVHSVAFSPDGSRFASAGWDGTIRIWGARSLETVGILHGHEYYVSSVAFSPDGSTLASLSYDGTLRVWTTQPASKRAEQRAAADEVRELAQPIFRGRMTELLSSDKVAERLRGETALRLDVRESATRMARALDDSPDGLNQTSWQIVSRPHGSPEDYAYAATLIDAARRTRPDEPHFLVTRGAAHFRLGQFEQAVATLDLADPAPEEPAHAAFLAMSHEKRGDHAAAVVALLRLRAYMSDVRWENDREAQRLFCETEATVAGRSMLRVGND